MAHWQDREFSCCTSKVFDYERVVKILLFIVAEHSIEENSFVQRAGIYLLNSLACQVDGQQKLLLGSLGAMEKMLGLIRERVSSGRARCIIIYKPTDLRLPHQLNCLF